MAENYVLQDVMISRDKIAARTAELAKEIAADIKDNQVLLVGILTGAAPFLTDLARAMPEDMDVRIDFMSVSSYAEATKSSGVVRILHDLKQNIEGKNVVVVEDIIDSGYTLSYLLRLLKERKPASLKTCVLLDKFERREAPIAVDYCGFTIPDAFVVGYGLDYAHKWRHLKDIRTVAKVDE